MITVSGLTKSYGARVLFRDVTFQVSDGRRIALVGGNGAGKTTLLEIVLGTTEADGGEVHRPKDLTIGYLPQEITEWRDGSVLDEVLAGRPEVQELERRLARLHDDLATTSGVDHERALAAFGEAQSRFEALGGYAVEADAHRVLAGLGFAPGDAARPLTDMSGGWRMRAALGRLLLAQPEVLILDEPTNHLDTDSVTWLEDTLSSYAGAVLFVSHDRDFIDAVAERVIELAAGTATEYVGGFAEFVVQREERLARLRSLADRQARDIAHIERFVERFRYKATKARQVQSRIKTLEKLDRIEVPDHRARVARFGFPPPQRSSRLVAELVDVTVGYDGVAVLSDVDFAVERGEKVALVGPNGAGKTTLLRLLLGELAPMKGTCTIGANVDVAYFAQHQVEALDLEHTRPAGDPGRRRHGAAGPQPAQRARLLRLLGRGRRPQGGRAVGRRADPTGPGQDHDQPGQPARARRADEPPRPGQLRRARGRARRLPGHHRPRDARPLPHPGGGHLTRRRARWAGAPLRGRRRGDPLAPRRAAGTGTQPGGADLADHVGPARPARSRSAARPRSARRGRRRPRS